jgi:hypothetical protein
MHIEPTVIIESDDPTWTLEEGIKAGARLLNREAILGYCEWVDRRPHKAKHEWEWEYFRQSGLSLHQFDFSDMDANLLDKAS